MNTDTFFHLTKDGERINIKDLKTSHLINIIKFLERRAKEGVKIQDCEEEYVIYHMEALRKLNYFKYLEEFYIRMKKYIEMFENLEKI